VLVLNGSGAGCGAGLAVVLGTLTAVVDVVNIAAPLAESNFSLRED
jgi:hypothetical protein